MYGQFCAFKKQYMQVCALYSLSFSVPFLFVSLSCILYSVQGESVSSHAQAHQPQLSSEERKQKWEQGQADYMGRDSFENIKKKLDTFLK